LKTDKQHDIFFRHVKKKVGKTKAQIKEEKGGRGGVVSARTKSKKISGRDYHSKV